MKPRKPVNTDTARVSPVEAVEPCQINQLDALLLKAPRISPDDATDMAAVVAEIRQKLKSKPNPRAS